MSDDLCPRCGSSGYGCYECTPTTYTRAQMEAAVKRALEGAATEADKRDLSIMSMTHAKAPRSGGGLIFARAFAAGALFMTVIILALVLTHLRT